jgi:hypothetical protein
MSVKSSNKDPLSILSIFERARDESAQMRDLGEPMSDVELHLRAELVAKIIETRGKLQMMRDKTEELQHALERFTIARKATQA